MPLKAETVEIPLVHRVSAAASGEMEFVHACLSRISLAASSDVRSVALGPSVDFSTGCVYRALHSSGCIVPGQDVNWDCFAPLKVKVFFWIMRLQKTRTRALLHRLGCVPSTDCPFCPGQPEDISHLFVGCPRLRPLWNIISPSGAPGPMMTMVFDADLMSTLRVLDMVADHLRLWVVRAPSSVDTTPLLACYKAGSKTTNDHRSARRAELAPLQVQASKQAPETTTIKPPSRSWVTFSSRHPASKHPPEHVPQQPRVVGGGNGGASTEGSRTGSPPGEDGAVARPSTRRNSDRSITATHSTGEEELDPRRPKGSRRRCSYSDAAASHQRPHPIYKTDTRSAVPPPLPPPQRMEERRRTDGGSGETGGMTDDSQNRLSRL
ncbi:hypothetical protein QYE76_061245 [Lolium multiflorum]|uniref:Reverse transcriptase zinc-binding domain-containing protein n=1 Tax=Lolium multiflorum TaxID=4521 RepID=A0AAD8S2T8_LOLMU|nr:hypothetical protein QYE76_061245 [Lolium multiflorum]